MYQQNSYALPQQMKVKLLLLPSLPRDNTRGIRKSDETKLPTRKSTRL